jgi:hypothetical protein
VRPDVYDRYRAAVRGEPFLWIKGKLAKDDGTVNVLAEEVEGLRLVGAQHAAPLHDAASPFAYLKSLRRVAPDSKDWG